MQDFLNEWNSPIHMVVSFIKFMVLSYKLSN